MHVTKVYFIQLVLKIKYVKFEDKPNNFYLKTENVKIFTARTSYQKMKNTNFGRLSAKVADNRFDRTHCDDLLKICCLYAVLVLPGSVETQLGCNGKFY